MNENPDVGAPRMSQALPAQPAVDDFLTWVARLVHRHRLTLLRDARRRGLSAEDALDSVQDAFQSFMRLPEGPSIRRVVVPDGPDAADDWIAERAGNGDIVVTADIPLAARCLKTGARVVGPTGKPFTDTGIGMALAMRDLSRHLRETGESKGYNAAFTRQDRSRFLQALEEAVQAIKRGG